MTPRTFGSPTPVPMRLDESRRRTGLGVASGSYGRQASRRGGPHPRGPRHPDNSPFAQVSRPAAGLPRIAERPPASPRYAVRPVSGCRTAPPAGHSRPALSCLLYTSDAADEEDSVDLGGRRII